ncbi:MAG TPA: DUF4383 domain-containing protein [Acidobacteriota bacterium]|jgi:hypothetical protein
MAKTLAWIFGVVFLLVAILGFRMGEGMLLGYFAVNQMHNLVHLLSGIAAIGAALAGERYARMYFQIFGVVYLLVTIIGFATGNLLGMTLNMADNILHLAIAAVALIVGFVGHRAPAAA